MNDLIQSLPSLQPIVGITYTWMGESWMVDGEASVMMIAMISSNFPSWQGVRTEFLVPNWGFWWWRRSGTLSGKTSKPPSIFRLGALCMWKEGSRRWLRWPHHPQVWPRVAHMARWCGPLVARLRIIFWLRESSSKIGILRYFLGIFLKVGFLHKNETPEQFC
jgi:hypothetical protein